MTTLTIHNLDPATLSALETRARAHGRSVEDEAQALLAQAATASMDFDTLLAWTDRIRAMTPKDVEQPDSADLVREDRDSR